MIGCDCPELHQHPLLGDLIFRSTVTRLDLGTIAIDDDAVGTKPRWFKIDLP